MGKMHLEERTHIVYGREAMSLSSKTKSHSVDFGTVQPHSGVGRGRSIHGISINRVTEEKLQFGCSSIRRGGGVWKEANSVFICVTGESSWWSPHSLLHSTFNPRIACHSFLTEFFFPLSFLSFFPSYRYTLISHLSLTSSLFSFYIFLATSSPLSLSLSRRFRWYPIIPFLQPLFFIPSIRRFFHTHIHTYIYTRSFHSPFSIFRSYQN